MSSWWARWTIGVEIPHPKERIRHAIQFRIPNSNEQPWEHGKALHHLLKWMRQHPAHPDLPEYADRSYLPQPDVWTDASTDEELGARGIWLVREPLMQFELD